MSGRYIRQSGNGEVNRFEVQSLRIFLGKHCVLLGELKLQCLDIGCLKVRGK